MRDTLGAVLVNGPKNEQREVVTEKRLLEEDAFFGNRGRDDVIVVGAVIDAADPQGISRARVHEREQ